MAKLANSSAQAAYLLALVEVKPIVCAHTGFHVDPVRTAAVDGAEYFEDVRGVDAAGIADSADAGMRWPSGRRRAATA